MTESISVLTEIMLCAVFCSVSSVTIVYVWHLSELANNARAVVEARDHLWWGKLLTCPYCTGTWTTVVLWILISDFLPPTKLLQVLGVLFSTGLFYLAWAAFSRLWRPL